MLNTLVVGCDNTDEQIPRIDPHDKSGIAQCVEPEVSIIIRLFLVTMLNVLMVWKSLVRLKPFKCSGSYREPRDQDERVVQKVQVHCSQSVAVEAPCVPCSPRNNSPRPVTPLCDTIDTPPPEVQNYPPVVSDTASLRKAPPTNKASERQVTIKNLRRRGGNSAMVLRPIPRVDYTKYYKFRSYASLLKK